MSGLPWSAPASPWPLTGRDEEIAFVREAVERSHGIVLAGEAGVGKTRLGREAAASLAADGMPVEWVTATAAGSAISLATFSHLMPDAALRPEVDRLLQYRALAGALVNRHHGGRFLLAVDDAHLLDAASASLVLHLANVSHLPLLVMLRSGQRCADPIVALWKDEIVPRLDLQAVGRADVDRLLHAVVGGIVATTTVDRLFEVTQGNLLFLHEIVNSALSAGAFAQRDGVWHWSGEIASTRLNELITERLSNLTPGQLRCLRLIAIAEPIRLDLLEACGDREDLAGIETVHLIRIEDGPNGFVVRPAHPMFGEILRAQMPATVKRALSRDITEALTGLGPKGADAIRRATWLLDGGGPSDPDLLTQAAADANARFDHDAGLRFADAAVEAGAGLAAILSQAEALSGLSRAEESAALLGSVEAAASVEEAAEKYLRLRVSLLHEALNKPLEAEALLDRAEAWRRDPQWKRTLAMLRQRLLLDAGRFADALEAGMRLIGDEEIDPVSRLWALPAVGTSLAAAGRTDEALTLADQAAPLVQAGDDYGLLGILATRFSALLYQGRWQAMEPVLDDFAQSIVSSGNVVLVPIATYLRAQSRLSSGNVLAARRLLEEATAAPDPLGNDPALLSDLAYTLALAGDVDAAAAAMTRADAAFARTTAEVWWQKAFMVRSQVWIHALQGDPAEAAAVALDYARTVEGPLGEAAMIIHEAVRAGCDRRTLIRPLRESADRVDAPLIHAFADHGTALARSDGASLDVVATVFEGFGALLLAAEAAAEAAQAHRRAGRESNARRSAAVSARLRDACPGAATPALMSLAGAPGLTAREREVAALAARGLKNSDIARALSLSVRTVESHVYRACLKLGASSRDELREVTSPIST